MSAHFPPAAANRAKNSGTFGWVRFVGFAFFFNLPFATGFAELRIPYYFKMGLKRHFPGTHFSRLSEQKPE